MVSKTKYIWGNKAIRFNSVRKFSFEGIFRKKRVLSKAKVNYRDFDEIARRYLEIIVDITNNEARYALVLDREFLDMPAERFFAINCRSHKAVVPSDTLSLDD